MVNILEISTRKQCRDTAQFFVPQEMGIKFIVPVFKNMSNI